MSDYKKRVVDRLLERKLKSAGSVLIEGESPRLIDKWQIAPTLRDRS